ncbi:MAG: flagellar basal body protein [Robiginitomaculum sp.]|nr:MAG: flagellar basal body protein [Robiginitomaculum sp.]
MALHAHNAKDRVEQMLLLTQRLRALVERETVLFEARTPNEAAMFADEKNTLATTYRLETVRIAKDPSLIADAPAVLRQQLRKETVLLDEALQANNRIAGIIRKLTEGMVQAIASEAAKIRASMNAYGPNGRVNADDAAVAITLNRQV